MKRTFWALAIAVSCLLAGPTAALATTYNFTSGSVTVSGTAGPTVLFGSELIPLTGTSVTFDLGAGTVGSILLAGGTTTATSLSTAFGGFDEFTLDSFTIAPGTSYTSSVTPSAIPGTYTFVAGSVDVAGFATAHDTTGALPDTVIPFGFSNPTVAGSINVNTGVITMNAITLGVIAVPGEPDPLVVTASILFTGFEAPEPNSLGLLGFALVAMVLRARRSA